MTTNDENSRSPTNQMDSAAQVKADHMTGVGLERWRGEFPATRWSLLCTSSSGDERNDSKTGRLLAEMASQYWYPVYSYIRRRGHSSHNAQDLTQEFFSHLLTGDKLRGAKEEHGRFRSYLLGAVNHFLNDVWKKETAQKRGGGAVHLSIDQEIAEQRFQSEVSDGLSPERVFDRQWALVLLEQVVADLRKEYEERDKSAIFDALKIYLTGEGERGSYGQIAEKLQTTEANVRTMVKRLRARCRELLKERIAQTIDSPDNAEVDAEDELRFLLASAGGSGP